MPEASEEHAKRVWSLGSYERIASDLLPMAAHLVDAAGIEANDEILDVACGTGNLAITAARRGAQVTGLDLVPAMLEQARDNARIAETEAITWREGNAVSLPFETDAFDATLSCVGHMFADPPEAAARELVRVTRPGGTVAFTAWQPESVVPAMAARLSEFVSVGEDQADPPFLWGDAATVRERLGDEVEDLTFEDGTIWANALSPEHFWQAARTDSGLFIVALEAVEGTDREALREGMVETISGFYEEDRNAVPLDYRLVQATVV